MNNLEKEKVIAFVNDVIMYEAVKKVLLSETQIDYTEIAKEIESNENLGAKTRALAEGKNFIENGFNKLLEYQKGETAPHKKNRAI